MATSSTVSTATEPVAVNSGEAEEILKSECEEIWEEINQLQKELKEKKKAEGVFPGNSLVSILAAKERLLKAQTEVLKDTQPKVLPQNDDFQYEVLKDELERSIPDLEMTLTFVQSEHIEAQANLEREQTTNEEMKQIKDVLEGKLEAVGENGQNPVNRDSVLEEIEKKNVAVSQQYRKLMKQMAAFVHEHFPTPSVEQIQEWRKKQKNKSSVAGLGHDPTISVVSLQTILEDLMNKCVETPHDAYLALTDAHWPPHIELLLRCGIALRHPETDNMIRLTPFHL